jgi:hypothetical protein
MKHSLSPFDALPPSKPIDGQQQTDCSHSRTHATCRCRCYIGNSKNVTILGCVDSEASVDAEDLYHFSTQKIVSNEELPQNMDEESHKYNACHTIFVDRRVAVLSGT